MIKYFNLLVVQEEPHLQIKSIQPQSIESYLELSKRKLLLKVKKADRDISDELYKYYHRSLIYASLGSKHKGVSLIEISKKSKLNKDTCLLELQSLEKLGAIALDRQGDGTILYKPQQEHLLFQDLKSGTLFQQFYLKTLRVLEKKIVTNFNHTGNLFYHSIFSVNAQRLDELKIQLRDLLTNFAHDSEAAEGEKIFNLICGFFEN